MALSYAVESWIWYAFAVGIIVARLASRTLLLGSPKALQYDDFIMAFFVTACYTVLIVMANIETEAHSNLLPPGFEIGRLSTQEIADRRYGSKIVIVVEQMQIAVIWACKACLLILYHRLTRMVAPKANVAVKILAAYIALGFIVMEILYFAVWCRPFSQYWAVPTRNSQCNALINHRITNAVFNISSDLIMLCIALPMFIQSLLPMKRKLILCCIFSLGIFVILAAVLNKYYSFKEPYEPAWIFWYTREASTAVLVANLPFTWTLLRKIFNLGAFDEERPPPPTYHSSRTAGGRRTARAYNHDGSRTCSTTTEAHHNHASKGSKGSRSRSLIGSICAPKEEKTLQHKDISPNATSSKDVSQNSQISNNTTLEEQAIQPHDFGSMMADLEQGLVSTASSSVSRTTSPRQYLSSSASSPPPPPRPLSPIHYHHGRKDRTPRVSVDGTGGFYINNRLTSPHRAYLAAGRSRESSIASADRRPGTASPRPMSPSSSRASCDGGSVVLGHAGGGGGGNRAGVGGGGGGRSAKDRRMRAKMAK